MSLGPSMTISEYIFVSSSIKGLCNNYLEGGGGWETRGGHREKSHIERGGHYFFYSFSQTRKVVEELCSYLLTLELNWENINSRCFDL